MRTRNKVLLGFGALIALAVVVNLIFPSEGQNTEFQPQNEFRLDPWVPIDVAGIDFSLNKAVLYLVLAAIGTVGALLFVANRMQARPNRVQTAVELIYDLTRNQMARGNMDEGMALKWFPFIGTLFIFIWISNIIGYIPLPTNTEHPISVFGIDFPAFAIYAATANLSVTLALTLMVCVAYHVAGIRAQGPIGYLKSWIPAGVTGGARVPIFLIEIISHLVRVVSLSVRLFANILAGHLLILFMGGGMAVLLGLAALGVFTLPIAIVFFIFEVVLVATLQAFIFATLTSLYLGGATAAHH